ncbi:hypothetical protein CK203_068895 [Vitis vinifera]|uniref:Uncharacterized protein n=1 Tax=Vitis vinifera TaxID=29760 RepID=A0A438EY21_VITVI|nr:hypothetical protein CK203_068895 [Vitis vinifera]
MPYISCNSLTSHNWKERELCLEATMAQLQAISSYSSTDLLFRRPKLEFDKKLDKYIFVILSEMGNLFLFSESSPYHDKLYWWRQLPFVPEVVLILIMSLLYQFCLKIPLFIYVDFGYGFNFVYQLGTRGVGLTGRPLFITMEVFSKILLEFIAIKVRVETRVII